MDIPSYYEVRDGSGMIVEFVKDLDGSVVIKICGQEKYFTMRKEQVAPTKLTCKFEFDLLKRK